MAECVLCNNTGKVAGSFCICTTGQVQKRVAKGNEKAEEMKKKEREQRQVRVKQMEQLELIPDEPKRQRDPFELYDWVEIIKPGSHRGMVCLVIEIQKVHHRVLIQGKNIKGWANYNDVKLAPISKKDEKDIYSLLEQAVFTKDEEWFNALHQDLAAIKGRVDFSA